MAAISNHINVVRSKDAERERIAADLATFLSKRGNRIQHYAMGAASQPVLQTRRQLTERQGSRTEHARRKASTP